MLVCVLASKDMCKPGRSRFETVAHLVLICLTLEASPRLSLAACNSAVVHQH